MNQNPISLKHDVEVEINFLGGLILEPEYFARIADILNEQKFISKKNQMIFKTIKELVYENEPVSYLTIQEKLINSINLGEIEVDYISGITDQAVIGSHLVYFANIIDENYKARKLNSLYEFGQNELAQNVDAESVWQMVSDRASRLFTKKESPYSIHDLMENLENINSSDDWGRNWGIEGLDRFVGPLSKEATVIIAGRPGHCKTSIASQIMDYWGSNGNKIFFQSMEMSRQEIDMRRLSRLSGIPLWRIKRGPNFDTNRNDDTYRIMINQAAGQIHDLNKNVIVSDRCGLSPEEIALNIKINHETNGINIFFLDNFHRVNYSKSGPREHRHAMEHGLEVIIAACKNNGIMPVILAQLNRGVENGDANREPRLSDLRECGRLEEAATNVLMMHWKFKQTQKETDKFTMKVLNAKARDGQTGRVFMRYYPEIYRFAEHLPGGEN